MRLLLCIINPIVANGEHCEMADNQHFKWYKKKIKKIIKKNNIDVDEVLLGALPVEFSIVDLPEKKGNV